MRPKNRPRRKNGHGFSKKITLVVSMHPAGQAEDARTPYATLIVANQPMNQVRKAASEPRPLGRGWPLGRASSDSGHAPRFGTGWVALEKTQAGERASAEAKKPKTLKFSAKLCSFCPQPFEIKGLEENAQFAESSGWGLALTFQVVRKDVKSAKTGHFTARRVPRSRARKRGARILACRVAIRGDVSYSDDPVCCLARRRSTVNIQ